MKIFAVTSLALALFCLAAMPAEAKGGFGPPGSYRGSCRDIHMEGSRLVALCRKENGRWVPTSLPGVRSCVGDIGNQNGHLACNYQ